MSELNLQVGMVGKLLVHYKLAKPNAVRIPNLVGSIATVEKYLKKNKAVLEAPPEKPVKAGKSAVKSIVANKANGHTNGKANGTAKSVVSAKPRK
jgi:hypothetical protein